MKLPRIQLPKPHVPGVISRAIHRTATLRIWATFTAIMYRLVPVIIFGLLFMQVAIIIDQNHYRNAPASDFLQYTEFTVQNARVNEDVYFKVCRTHVSYIHYTGDLNIYIISNPEQKDEQRIKVYGHDISGAIDNDCENKVIRASEFKHDPGTYEMSFCVSFNVKYGYEKQVCKTSNRYRIYPQPVDLQSQIRSLEEQLNAARTELQTTQGNINGVQDQSLDVGPSIIYKSPTPAPNTAPSDTTNKGNTAPTGNNGNANAGKSGDGIQPPSCALKVGNVGLACGTSGLLHL